VQSIGAASHPSFPARGSYDDWTANGIKGRRQDADWAFPEPSPDPSHESRRCGGTLIVPSGKHMVEITGLFRNT